MSHNAVHSINEKISDLLKKYAFLGKKSVFRISQISPNLLVGSY